MSDDHYVNHEYRPELENLDDNTKHTLRPAMVTFAVGAAIALASAILSAAAPTAFGAVGGWATSIVLIVVAIGVGSTLMVLRMNQHNRGGANRAPDSSGK
jgi:hypothetical protein